MVFYQLYRLYNLLPSTAIFFLNASSVEKLYKYKQLYRQRS